eukprot:CAMPEP_0196721962 /NCGR_PEP_ID=MMETSP1091-20130531/4405_1 /TAXON_ID=302021 /ORGANISM="Rhodomonas sp., Strain CCMP768" /LENGTH=362 /DNA_ID=CAMNT_0042063553 /DNA_START=40 /DNA_END=1128 /DNA_ORIENTATION=+
MVHEDPDFRDRILAHQEEDDLALVGLMDDPNVAVSETGFRSFLLSGAGVSAVECCLHQDGQWAAVDDLHRPRKLSELLEHDGVSGSNPALLASMLHRGLLTYAEDSAMHSSEAGRMGVRLVPPNKMASLWQLKKLLSALNKSAEDLARILLQPTAHDLQALFQRIVTHHWGTPAVLNRNFGEAAMQAAIASDLRGWLRARSSFKAEVRTEQRARGRYADVCIVNKDGAGSVTGIVVFEFKCIRTNALDWVSFSRTQEWLSRALTAQECMDIPNSIQIRTRLGELAQAIEDHETVLQRVPILPQFRAMYNNAGSVGDVMHKASTDLKENRDRLRGEDRFANCKQQCFVVLLVGTRIVVEEVRD